MLKCKPSKAYRGHTPTFTDQYPYVYRSIPLRLPINTPTFTLHITTNNINVVISKVNVGVLMGKRRGIDG